jgi:hypothetical protein
MKRINKFEDLSSEDQQVILNTCADNPYHVALILLAKPRSEGGLDFKTSRSALSRFCVHHHPDQRTLELLGQYADAVRIKGQAHLQGAYEAALTLVQARILEALRNGKAVADLDKEFRSLERLQGCLLKEEKRRKEQGTEKVLEHYTSHLRELASTPDVDYIRNDVENDPGAGGLTEADFDTESDMELDMLVAQDSSHKTPPSPPIESLAELVAALARQSPSAGKSAAPNHSKTPDFPHFPPNPASTVRAPRSASHPQKKNGINL